MLRILVQFRYFVENFLTSSLHSVSDFFLTDFSTNSTSGHSDISLDIGS